MTRKTKAGLWAIFWAAVTLFGGYMTFIKTREYVRLPAMGECGFGEMVNADGSCLRPLTQDKEAARRSAREAEEAWKKANR